MLILLEHLIKINSIVAWRKLTPAGFKIFLNDSLENLCRISRKFWSMQNFALNRMVSVSEGECRTKQETWNQSKIELFSEKKTNVFLFRILYFLCTTSKTGCSTISIEFCIEWWVNKRASPSMKIIFISRRILIFCKLSSFILLIHHWLTLVLHRINVSLVHRHPSLTKSSDWSNLINQTNFSVESQWIFICSDRIFDFYDWLNLWLNDLSLALSMGEE